MEALRIPLPGGLEAIIDASDAAIASKYNWTLRRSGRSLYVHAAIDLPDGRRTTVALHRVIMDAPKGLHVDHINSNGLDNRRSNLRVCTQAENNRNRRRNVNNTSGYKGVYFDKRTNRWFAQIFLNNRSFYLGRFGCPKDAHAAYCEAAARLHGEFARVA